MQRKYQILFERVLKLRTNKNLRWAFYIQMPTFNNYHIMGRIIAFILLTCSLQSFAQREKVETVKNVRGEFAMTADMIAAGGVNPKEKAREDAQRKAIEQVCGKQVNSWNMIESSAAGESYNSLAVIQTDGEIVGFEVLQEGTEVSPVRSSEIIFYCVANVKVKKGLSPDPNFSAKIDGVRAVYYENDELTFSVQPLIDCYLTIFLLENAEKGYKLYPLENDGLNKLEANRKIQFPRVDEWVMTKETNNPIETNRLLFVFTKKELKFPYNEESRAEIEKWMMKVPADQRYMEIKTIEIRK